MNSNRNRYSSAPTYGMQKRTTGKRPAYNKPKASSPQGSAATQGTPFSQGAGPMPGMMPGLPVVPPGSMMPPPGYPPVQGYGYAPQAPAYPTPSAGGMQTGPQAVGYPPVSGIVGPQQPLPYPPANPYTQAPVPQAQASPKVKGKRRDTWLQLLLLAILPILFIVAMVMKQTPLFWIFIGFALVGLCAMWLQSTFVSSARATLSLIYGALLIVSAVSVISGGIPRDTTTSANGNGLHASAQQSGGAPIQPTSDPALAGFSDIATPENPYLAEITPEPSVSTSEAAIQLENFMNLWYANKLDDMVSLCAPSWSAGLTDARKSLYAILANRLPVEFDMEKITGTDADSSRTVTMTVLIDKQNNREPSKYRFQVLMLKENGTWYVDPQSLASNEEVATPAPEGGDNASIATPEPTSAPSAKTKLYYNPDGGSYYHAVDNCSSVNAKYLPLSAFYYGDLEKTKFKNLKPCTKCGAPERP